MSISTPPWWSKRGAKAYALWPVSVAWRVGVHMRHKNVATTKMPVPVLCIGNVVAGGAGKTPVAIAVAKMLRAQGRKVVFLSRGYGGTMEGPVKVESSLHHSDQVGDEPLLLARYAPTIVSKDRLKGARMAVKEGAEVIVMDDGLQNPFLFKNCILMVVDGEYIYGNGMIMPAGPLRQPLYDALAKVNGIVMIGAQSDIATLGKPKFAATLEPVNVENIRGKRVVGFAGIGRPEKFQATLEEIGCEVVAFKSYADHRSFSLRDFCFLKMLAEKNDAILVCTEKDEVRLEEQWKKDVFAVPVELKFSDAQAVEKFISQQLVVP